MVAYRKPGRCAVTSNGLIVRCLLGVGRSLQAYCDPQGGSFIYFMAVPSALVELPTSYRGSWIKSRLRLRRQPLLAVAQGFESFCYWCSTGLDAGGRL
ncbi:hypothetical protein EMIT051CA3_60392 [Pseudomonas chlororaphis]